MATLTIDTIYRVMDEDGIASAGRNPSIQITGASATLNAYMSNEIDKPANLAAMTQFLTGVSGTYTFIGKTRWFAYEAAANTPVVIENGLTEGTS